jgi:hypothetical protein
MANYPTKFQVDGRDIVVKHGCKTIEFNLDEANQVLYDLKQSIEEVKNYKPDIADHFDELLGTFHKLERMVKKKRIQGRASIVKDYVLHILDKKEHLDKIRQILNSIDLELSSDEVKKIVDQHNRDKEIELQKEIKEYDLLKDDADLLNDFFANFARDASKFVSKIKYDPTYTPERLRYLRADISNLLNQEDRELNRFAKSKSKDTAFNMIRPKIIQLLEDYDDEIADEDEE